MKRVEEQICSSKAVKHTLKVCNRLWVERNTSKFQNGFVENLSNIALHTSLLSQTCSMMNTEGGVILDCHVSPNQDVFQGWNSKTWYSRTDGLS